MMTEPHRWVEDNFYMFPDTSHRGLPHRAICREHQISPPELSPAEYRQYYVSPHVSYGYQ